MAGAAGLAELSVVLNVELYGYRWEPAAVDDLLQTLDAATARWTRSLARS